METMKWMCAVAVMTQGLLTSSSANVLNVCRMQCREEEELKAACSEERNCASLLPNLNAFVDCLEPCTNLGNNCFQRCAFKTDRIAAICSRQCQQQGAPGRAIAAPGGLSSSGVDAANLGGEEAGVLCYKSCYDTLLNAAMNRLYTKRP